MLVSAVLPILVLVLALLAGGVFIWCWSMTRRLRQQLQMRNPPEAPPPASSERRILDNLNAVPWEWDLTEGRYTFVGQKMENLLGYPLESWYTSKIWRDSLHPEDVELVEGSFMRAVWAGGCGTYRYRVIHRDGRIILVESDISTLIEGNEPRFVCGTTRRLESDD